MTKKLAMVVGLAGALGILFILVPSAPTQAGGGPNWKVTVRNTSGLPCYVSVWVLKLLEPHEEEKKFLSAGATYTFETGAKCPTALTGFIGTINGWKEIRSTCLLTGNHVDESQCTSTCWDSSWTICRKAGTDTSNIDSDDYGFCKK